MLSSLSLSGSSRPTQSIFLLPLLLILATPLTVQAKGEAQRRWEMMNQIRQDKFDLVLPEVMREHTVINVLQLH